MYALLLALALGCKDKAADTAGEDPVVDGDGDGFLSDVDCDDASSAINPDAPEICDEIDNDCDGEIDEGIGSTWYPDEDEDGFGDEYGGQAACERPDGWVPNGQDCDDTDAATHPGANELCDGIDNDCDGVYDLCADLGTSDGQWHGDGDDDQAGYDVAGVGDVNGDGFDDVLVGVPTADDSGNNAGKAALVLGPGTGEHPLAYAAATLLGEDPSDQAGYAVARAGDDDADGWPDLAIGAWGHSDAGSSAGAVYVVRGPVSGQMSLSASDAVLIGETAGDGAGLSVAGVGDTDGDGKDDLLVGAPNHDGAASMAGIAYLVSGGDSGRRDLASAEARLEGEVEADQAASTLAGAGDVDGDGLRDILVGCYGQDGNGDGAGAAYLFYAPVTGDRSLGTADAVLFGEATGDHAGNALAGIGDVDGDGLDDFVVGAPDENSGDTGAGAIYLVTDAVSGTTDLWSASGAKIYGQHGGDHAGAAVASAGDVNGDGLGDLLLGAYLEDTGGTNAGAACLVIMPVEGNYYLSDDDPQINGEAEGDKAGWAVSSAGDVDADGQADMLVGAPKHADDEGNAVGVAYIVLGNRLETSE